MILLYVYLATVLTYALSVYLSRFTIYKINVLSERIIISNVALALLGLIPLVNLIVGVWFIILETTLDDDELKEIIEEIKNNIDNEK